MSYIVTDSKARWGGGGGGAKGMGGGPARAKTSSLPAEGVLD